MKKAAKEAIREKLKKEQDAIRWKLKQNIRSMRLIVDEQTKLKRELAIYAQLIRSIDE